MPLPDLSAVPEFIAEVNSIPTSVDWVTAGKVSPIQNQGSCGSCWAFSGTAAMESAHAIKTGTLVKLSEQQFVSCSTSYGD